MPILAFQDLPIHYESAGGGAVTLCLVHGSGGSTAVWRHQIEGLSDVARIVALDLPGHGRSGGEGIASIEEAAAIVRAVVDALGLARVVIGGHSMGGAVAQMVALTAPERTAGLVLVGTGARLRVMPKIFEAIEQDHARGAEFVIDLAVAAAAPESLRRQLVAATLRTPAPTFAGDFRACDRFDVMARVGEIHAPALIVCGVEDQLTPTKYSDFLRANIPGARLVLVPDAGHYVQLERPTEVTRAIREFLIGLVPREGGRGRT